MGLSLTTVEAHVHNWSMLLQCFCFLPQMDEQMYMEDCAQRCWCHPLSGALCEPAACGPGQRCALRNSTWGCHEQPGVCVLIDGLQLTTLGGQQLSLEPQTSYSLVSLCDEASELWFSMISYHEPHNGSSSFPSRAVTVLKVLLHGTSLTIQEDTVKVGLLFRTLTCIK